MASKVRVSGFPYMPARLIERKGANDVPVKGKAMLRVEAPQVVVMDGGLPVDLVAVLDVSGSMGWEAAPPVIGGESRLDVVKKAMKFVISELRDDKDRLAIVAFNHKVVKEYTTEFIEISGRGRISAEEKVDKLMPKGDTAAFIPALEHAVQILDARPADKSRVGFILLLSDGDGLDNSEFKWNDIITSTDPPEPSTDRVRRLLNKHPVHTFGLCKAHDPKALLLMAKESNGTYYSITDNLDSKIMEAFAVCLGGLKTVVATDTRVDIMSDKLLKAKITEIHSAWGYKRSISTDGGRIFIGILCADEVKDFIVDYEFTIATVKDKTTERNEYEPLKAGLQYNNDGPGNEPILIDGVPLIKVPVYSLPNQCHISMKEDLVPYANVLQQMVRFSILEQLMAFLVEFHDLKKQGEDAVDRKKGDCRFLQSVAGNMLKRRWEAFKKKDNGIWNEAGRFGLDLGGMNKDITAMVSNMKRGLSLACVYSWVSSYQMQRATTTCLPSTTAFLTNSMEAMMETARKKSEEDAALSNKDNKQPAPQLGEESSKCKLAFENLGGIDERLQLWVKLELPASGLEAGNESDSHNLRENIYQAAIQAINNLRISMGKQPHAATAGSDKNAHQALPGSHTKQ